MTQVTVDEVQHRQSTQTTTTTSSKNTANIPSTKSPLSPLPKRGLPLKTSLTPKLHFKLTKSNSVDVIVQEEKSAEVSHHYLGTLSPKSPKRAIRVLCKTPQPSRHQLARGARFLTTIALACDPSRIGEPLGAISPKTVEVVVEEDPKTPEEAANNSKSIKKLLLRSQASIDQSKLP